MAWLTIFGFGWIYRNIYRLSLAYRQRPGRIDCNICLRESGHCCFTWCPFSQ